MAAIAAIYRRRLRSCRWRPAAVGADDLHAFLLLQWIPLGRRLCRAGRAYLLHITTPLVPVVDRTTGQHRDRGARPHSPFLLPDLTHLLHLSGSFLPPAP